MALAQAEKKEEQKRIGWPKNVCGDRRSGSPDSGPPDGGLPLLLDFIEHHHRDKGSDTESFICIPRSFKLPAENVHVYLGKRALIERRELTSPEELDAVVNDLCRNWKGEQNLPLRASHKANRSLRASPELARTWGSLHGSKVGKTWRFFATYSYTVPF